jgi:hypothetical protein
MERKKRFAAADLRGAAKRARERCDQNGRIRMTTMLRAAIMLAVLVGLPTAWMYYGPLPPQAQRTVDRLVASAKEALDWDKRLGVETEADAPPREIDAGHVVEAAPAFAAERPAVVAASPVIQHAQSAELELARRVEPLLARLRELGVAAYALEPWGGDRRLFRFHCEMPLAGSDAITQQFEAIAADPQQSVAQVVADVTNWHASRSVATLR